MTDNGRPGPKRPVTFRVFRYKPGEIDPPRFVEYKVDVDPRMVVLDALEEIRTTQDSTLLYRQSCHHGSCGTCAMKVNGLEVLTCVTNVSELGTDTVVVEPLSVLPLIADLVVDMDQFAAHFQPAGMRLLRRSEFSPGAETPPGVDEYERYENCIECGACVSACPITNTDPEFLGPAALAAAHRALEKCDNDPGNIFALVDQEHGVWRCHTAMECTAVCPTGVDPGGHIMRLRRRTVGHKIRHLLRMS